MLAVCIPSGMINTDGEDSTMLGAEANGSGTQSDPYKFTALAGDQYRYTLKSNANVTYEIASGDNTALNLSLSGNVLSGTLNEGKETICISATPNEGEPTNQYFSYSVYNVLTLDASLTAVSPVGEAYEYTFTITDVDPDAENETVLTLNEAAKTAGYVIEKVSETSYKLTRTLEKNVAGSVSVTITASTSSGGIKQTETATALITTYDKVGITSLPEENESEGIYVTGLTVWLIEDETKDWEYTVTAIPEEATVSISGNNEYITFDATTGVLTVDRATPFASTDVTITVTSEVEGSEGTETQILSIRNWAQTAFESEISLTNITVNSDGRTINAAITAANQSTIRWYIDDVLTYSNMQSITHTFAKDSVHSIRVVVGDDFAREKASTTNVILVSDESAPTETDEINWIALVLMALGIILIIASILGAGSLILGIIIGLVLLGLGASFFFEYLSIDAILDWLNGLLGEKE